MKIPPVEAELFYADGLSGRPDYIFTVVLREFAKASKNKTFLIYGAQRLDVNRSHKFPPAPLSTQEHLFPNLRKPVAKRNESHTAAALRSSRYALS